MQFLAKLRPSLIGFTLLMAASSAVADTSAELTNGALHINLSAVEPGVFHLVVNSAGDPMPPTSPFIVEKSFWSGAKVSKTGETSATVQTAQGKLIFSNGQIKLLDSTGKSLISGGILATANGTLTFTLTHDAQERFYGAGNESENHSGDLTHPSGSEIVNNGTTRIPFLWSTGNWSVLVANNVGGSTWHEDNGTLTWTMPAPYLDVFLSVGKGGYGLLDAYSRLTGRAPIPPKWTFGYMISRWGYKDAADVQDKWHQFRDRKIPVDTFIYDYDWFVKDWQFNPNTFPSGSLDQMKALGLHFVGIRKPRVNDENLTFARNQGWILSSPLGTDLRFDIPSARAWWWSNHVPLVQAGVAGWWNDEAEQTMDEFFQMTKTEWDGWHAMSPQRAWSISRAFAPGMQRFGAAAWTGDINSDWETLQNQPGTLLNWGLAGMPYSGQDIGGFQGLPSPELYTRWVEEGVFVPVMRSHGTYNSPRWPWAFGNDAQAAMTKAIELRYKLIPYLYTLASHTAATGAPIIRPLFLEFPNDQKTFNLRDEWLLGDRLLAAPVLNEGGARDVYLPEGKWYDFNTSAALDGGQTIHVTAPLDVIPSYVRAGTILPLGPVIQSTSLGIEDPLEIRVYPGADGAFTLYEDDGDTYAYQNGESSRISFNWNDKTGMLTIGKRTGSFKGMLETRHLNILLPNGTHKEVVYKGSAIVLQIL